MPRLLLTAALSCASACSLLVSFEDLDFVGPGSGGSGGQGAQAGAGGAGGNLCGGPPPMGGDLGDLTPGSVRQQPGAEFEVLARDGRNIYAAGQSQSEPLILLKLDEDTLGETSRITGGVAHVTALAGNGDGVFFAGVANQEQMLEGACNESLSQGLFVAAWHANDECTVLHHFGMASSSGLLRSVVALGGSVVVAGHAEAATWCQPINTLQHFIASHAPGGGCNWSKAFLLGELEEGIYATATTSDRVVVAGSYRGPSAAIDTCDLGEANGVDAFIAVLDGQTGSCVTKRTLSGAGTEVATALAVDGPDIFVMGHYDGSPDFADCEPLPDAGAGGGAFLAKLRLVNNELQMLWARGFTTSGGVVPGGLAFLSPDDIRLAGSFKGDGNFGGGELENSSGAAQIFAAKLDANGKHVVSAAAASTETGAGEDDVVRAIVPNGRGMVVAGSFQGDTPLLGTMAATRVGYVVDTDLQP